MTGQDRAIQARRHVPDDIDKGGRLADIGRRQAMDLGGADVPLGVEQRRILVLNCPVGGHAHDGDLDHSIMQAGGNPVVSTSTTANGVTPSCTEVGATMSGAAALARAILLRIVHLEGWVDEARSLPV